MGLEVIANQNRESSRLSSIEKTLISNAESRESRSLRVQLGHLRYDRTLQLVKERKFFRAARTLHKGFDDLSPNEREYFARKGEEALSQNRALRTAYTGMRAAAAFTLVELLVVIAIIGLLTTGAIFGAVRSKRITSLNRAAREVLLALRDAQNKSLITQRGSSGVVPCGYGIHHDSADEKGFIIFREETSPQGEECIATSTPDQNIDR